MDNKLQVQYHNGMQVELIQLKIIAIRSQERGEHIRVRSAMIRKVQNI